MRSGYKLDCDNSQHSTYNLRDNDINILADSFSCVNDSYIATTGDTGNIGIQLETESKANFIYNCKIENMAKGIEIDESNLEDEIYPDDDFYNTIDNCRHICYRTFSMPRLADKIKQCRKLKGLTQERLARDLGVSLNTVQRWESGKNKPSPLALEKLQRSLDDVLEGDQLRMLLE